MNANFAFNTVTGRERSDAASAAESTFLDKEETAQMQQVLERIKEERQKRKSQVGPDVAYQFPPESSKTKNLSLFAVDSIHGVSLKMSTLDDERDFDIQASEATEQLQHLEDHGMAGVSSFVDHNSVSVKATRVKSGAEIKDPGENAVSPDTTRQCRIRPTMDSGASNVSYDDDVFFDTSHPLPSVVQQRRTTMGSCFSDITYHGDDSPTCPPDLNDVEVFSNEECTNRLLPSPNDPHPALDFPPLYFLIKKYPRCLKMIQYFYRFRWRVSYPLQRRLNFSKTLRKVGIYLTWGELLLLLPFLAALLVGTLYSFVSPSVSITGHACRTPLIFAFATAMHNSFFTLLLGIPFERALWYHKLSGRIAFVNAILHTHVSFWYPVPHAIDAYTKSRKGEDTDFIEFSFADQINTAGSMLLIFMFVMLATSIPAIRHKVFEIFYYIHIIFAVGMIGCAFYHSGVLVPSLAGMCWGGDVLTRKLLMAVVRYPRSASIRAISDTVVELSFPKSKGFDFNPGQYIYLALPELSVFEWHPFSLSSSPRQKLVTLHIRKSGAWTTALYDLAKRKSEVSILFEGPYGSLGVDLMSRDRYKMVMLFSGGIGVTPGQSICNQLLYEHSTKQRDLKKLSFIWIERDPVVMKKVEVLRRTSSVRYSINMNDPELESALERVSGELHPEREETVPMGLASTILALVPVSGTTDEQLEKEYPIDELVEDGDDDEKEYDTDDFSSSLELFGHSALFPRMRNRRKSNESDLRPSTIAGSNSFVSDQAHPMSMSYTTPGENRLGGDDGTFSVADTFLDKAYSGRIEASTEEVFDLQVYLTEERSRSAMSHLPFVQMGRPDIKQIFLNMKEEAIAKGERRVAVCVCAPACVVHLCRKACTKYSDGNVCFDFHEEVFS